MATDREDNAGAVALRRVGETDEQMAARTGAHHKLVNHWRKGRRKPTVKIWRPVLRNMYAIPVDAWDQPVSKNVGQGGLLDRVSQSVAPVAQVERAPACTGEVPSSSLGGGSTAPADLARDAAARIHALRRDLDNDPTRTIESRVKAEQACTNMLRQVYELTGEGGRMSEAQMVQTPAFRRVLDAIKGATNACAKCSQAIATTLEGLD